MTTRILVAYASMFGSTGQIAQVLGAALRDAHTVVDVRAVNDVNDVHAYHAVVIGSAIYNGHWLPDAVHFVRIHEAALCHLPVAYFAACMLLQRPTSFTSITDRTSTTVCASRSAAPSTWAIWAVEPNMLA